MQGAVNDIDSGRTSTGIAASTNMDWTWTEQPWLTEDFIQQNATETSDSGAARNEASQHAFEPALNTQEVADSRDDFDRTDYTSQFEMRVDSQVPSAVAQTDLSTIFGDLPSNSGPGQSLASLLQTYASGRTVPEVPLPSERRLQQSQSIHTDVGNITDPSNVDMDTTGQDYEQIARTDERDHLDEDNKDDGSFQDVNSGLFGSGYQLREAPRKLDKFFYGSTFLDMDRSGNYDPNAKPTPLRPQRRQLRLTEHEYFRSDESTDDEREQEEEGGIPKKARIRSWAAGRQAGDQLWVELKFRSEKTRLEVQKILDTIPNPSEAAENPEPTAWKDPDGGTSNSDGLRTCRRTSKHAKRKDYCTKPSIDLTGHPVARGCWGCFSLRIRCPLLDDDATWPCVVCVDDEGNNCDCELITPPERKRSCESCKRRRLTCSYTRESDHSQPCQNCSERGNLCIAGPEKGAARERNSIDKYLYWNSEEERWLPREVLPKKTPKPKPHVSTSCAQCVEAGRSCSLSSGSTKAPCTACDMSGQTCSQKLSGARYKGAKTQIPRPSTNGLRNEAPVQEQQGETKSITTKLCHPITFNYEDETGGQKPCNFCAGPNYPIFGLGHREVEVIDWFDGRGYTEISGGHHGEGEDSTRVCMACTMLRVQVCSCETHDIVPIPGRDAEALDVEGAYMRLLDASNGGGHADLWCSICPGLATHACNNPQSMDTFVQPQVRGIAGCGLLLCDSCAPTVAHDHGGDLQTMLASLKDEESAERPLGLRADFEMLKIDGLLMRYVVNAHI